MQGLIGISIDQVKTSTQGPEFQLGTLGLLNSVGPDTPTGDRIFMYVKAKQAVTARGYLVVVDTAFEAELLDTTSSAPGAGAGRPVGSAGAAIALNGYGWVQVYGRGPIRTLADAAVGTELTSSATEGAVDDATTTGLEVINGLSLGTATGTAEATNEDGFLNFPYVGRTL